MVGPDYQRPHVNVPATYCELPGWTQAEPAAAGPKGDWWTGFNDPLMDELEPLVSVSNQTVRQDYANYQEALAEVQVARAGLFPTHWRNRFGHQVSVARALRQAPTCAIRTSTLHESSTPLRSKAT